MPYEAPLAWRCEIAPSRRFSRQNPAYAPYDGESSQKQELTTYSASSTNQYFGWQDTEHDDARRLAEKFLDRFPLTASAGLGRDWCYAGWLSELVGYLERGALLPFVFAEFFEPPPEKLWALPIRDLDNPATVLMNFPLPPPPNDQQQSLLTE
ncbi:MAG: hypothetical protein ACR2IG_17575 [Roseomonas sp.]